MNNILEKNGFYGVIEFSEDCDCFRGRLLGINDLVTFEGETVSKIKQSFYAAVDNYIKVCKESGKATEKTYEGRLYVRIDPEIHKRAELEASAENITISKFVETAIKEKLRNK